MVSWFESKSGSPQKNKMLSTPEFIRESVLWSAILSSALISTVVGFLLAWLKEFFQSKSEKEQKQFENLYGPLTFNLLVMRSLNINRDELLREISKEPVPEEPAVHMGKYSDVVVLVKRWNLHKNKLVDILERNAGYIKKDHITLIGNFLDGCVKRDITKDGQSARTTKERTEKVLNAVEALQNELLGRL